MKNSILKFPFMYNGFQRIIGAAKFRKFYSENYLCATAGMRVLDIGCGTGEIIEYLPDGIDYVGIDLSASYISKASQKYGSRGRWLCCSIDEVIDDMFSGFDLVMANGVLHHLSDESARHLCRVALRAVAEGGRFCTVDPAFHQDQSTIARYLISNDRGEYVREWSEYVALVDKEFKSREAFVIHNMLNLPYTHAVTVSKR